MVSAKDFKEIKGKVDAEMQKRCLNNMDVSSSIDFGSLREAAENSAFEHPVEKGGLMRLEHGEKTINFLYEIKDIEGVAYAVEHGLIPSAEGYLTMEDFLKTVSSETMTGDSSSCRGACTGLCFGSCIGACNGCSDACTGDCSGCTATCGAGCANSLMYA